MTDIKAVIDMETNGLSASIHWPLEIAVILVDSEYNEIAEPFHRVVSYTSVRLEEIMRDADSYVHSMHEETGLWDRLRAASSETFPLDNSNSRGGVDWQLADYLMKHGAEGAPTMGNSHRLDMNFIDRHFPMTADILGYRMQDVSGMRAFLRDWFPEGFPELEKTSDHTALHDVRECIREAKFYRDFVLDRTAKG